VWSDAVSADEDIDSKFPSNVVVYADGNCSWVPLGLFISSCSIDIRWFPFDDQRCRLKFGSWTYDGRSINMTLLDGGESAVSLDTYQPSGEWQLIGKCLSRRRCRALQVHLQGENTKQFLGLTF